MVSLNPNEGEAFAGTAVDGPPGRPFSWQVPLRELERVESQDPAQILTFVAEHQRAVAADRIGIGLLFGARGCATLGRVPLGAASPVAVPECVAVAFERGTESYTTGRATVGEWRTSWSDAEHAHAVHEVRQAISRGDVYQANVVGHRSAAFTGDPLALAAALPGARYAGSLTGDGWLVASASPEQAVRVRGNRITTEPIKGTGHDPAVLRASGKDRAEHVMIVDLERNDLARVTESGSVVVEDFYAVASWAGLWHASSVVAGRLRTGVTTADILTAVLPGGSVTGAPKYAACRLLASLEPVGRGPAMGAMGFLCAEGLDLGLTIRTLAAADNRVHLWAGGGITWGSDLADEVAEAHAKAAPILRALG
jgi:para-aminobenzoate synthetase component 1